jgi:FdhE protein
VVGVLRSEGDGAKRSLLCSLCGTEWQYRRVICPSCGEENKDKLPVYLAEQIAHVRVDACDSCQTYVKSVDLTKDGHAVPIVDELATVALNIWAEEHGYTKFEPNLLGM